ncbi:vacuolar aminopeptidase 1 [Sporothrix stenoceras]|uniref:Vacuolar aminopeptidase 1 n=1 Tax=Sporothrix stenoceras TaxID=5173 RepID=A0ABR3YY94_9PEZI
MADSEISYKASRERLNRRFASGTYPSSQMASLSLSSAPPVPSIPSYSSYAPSSASSSASSSAFSTPTSSPPLAPTTTPVYRSRESQCYHQTGMANRSVNDNVVCFSCADRMNDIDLRTCHLVPPTGVTRGSEDRNKKIGACVVCAWKRGDAATFTKPFLHFITENPTVFHAVDYFENQLADAGFEKLSVRGDWSSKIAPGGKYYVTRNGSSLIAFTVGGSYVPGNGVAIVAGHIDALTAKLKPVSSKPTKVGYQQLGVAPYAGALNETWWDRDLAIGGRVVVQDPETKKTKTRLVKLGWPIAKVATLAPHFGVSMTGSGNKETQMVPIIGLEGPGEKIEGANAFVAAQPPKLVKLIAGELGIDDYSSILHWELELYDHQPATVLGVDRDLISAGRIDDKICSWAALTALLRAEDNDASGVIRLAALFDDEEIGSLLRQGAKGNFLPITIERAVEALCKGDLGPGLVGRTYAASYLVSADVTHAVHPNFVGNYLEDHNPQLNVGITVAYDSNGHMTTDTVSTAILARVADLSGATLQKFMIRNDSRSGGTIGPSLSSMLGVRSIDAGIPQLSMHSIRATTGALDPGLGVQLFQGFFEHYEQVDGEWQE